MVPFRSAIMTISSPDEYWDKLSPFITSIALQCYRNNYAWTPARDNNVDDISRKMKLVNELKEYGHGLVNDHVKDGVPDSDLLMR